MHVFLAKNVADPSSLQQGAQARNLISYLVGINPEETKHDLINHISKT